MNVFSNLIEQVTVSACVTRDESGTEWLQLREGGRHFAVSIQGGWHGRITLEVRAQAEGRRTPETLEFFSSNTEELFLLEHDADVRLWVRAGEFGGGEAHVELGT